MLELVLIAFYYFLPAYASNLIPPFLSKLKFLDIALDFGKKINGKRFLGSHKTMKGVLAAVIFGTFTFYVQKLVYQYPFFHNISIIDYSSYSLLLGFLLAFGVMFGDSLESFFKRRVGVLPGKPWIPFDQLDFVAGAFLFSFFIFIPSNKIILTIILISPILQLSSHYIGYLLKITKDKI